MSSTRNNQTNVPFAIHVLSGKETQRFLRRDLEGYRLAVGTTAAGSHKPREGVETSVAEAANAAQSLSPEMIARIEKVYVVSRAMTDEEAPVVPTKKETDKMTKKEKRKADEAYTRRHLVDKHGFKTAKETCIVVDESLKLIVAIMIAGGREVGEIADGLPAVHATMRDAVSKVTTRTTDNKQLCTAGLRHNDYVHGKTSGRGVGYYCPNSKGAGENMDGMYDAVDAFASSLARLERFASPAAFAARLELGNCISPVLGVSPRSAFPATHGGKALASSEAYVSGPHTDETCVLEFVAWNSSKVAVGYEYSFALLPYGIVFSLREAEYESCAVGVPGCLMHGTLNGKDGETTHAGLGTALVTKSNLASAAARPHVQRLEARRRRGEPAVVFRGQSESGSPSPSNAVSNAVSNLSTVSMETTRSDAGHRGGVKRPLAPPAPATARDRGAKRPRASPACDRGKRFLKRLKVFGVPDKEILLWKTTPSGKAAAMYDYTHPTLGTFHALKAAREAAVAEEARKAAEEARKAAEN